MQRRFKKSISFKKNKRYFSTLYNDKNGYEASRCALGERHATRLIYGEIEFYSFAALLSLLKPKPEDVFMDLGSGTGKPCVAAALAFNVHRCVGIEILPDLHQLALSVYEQSKAALQQQLTFVCDDYLKQPLNDASIIYVNATGLFGEDWDKVQAHLIEQISPKARLMISSKSLKSPDFKHLALKPVMMNYGQSHVNIYRRL